MVKWSESNVSQKKLYLVLRYRDCKKITGTKTVIAEWFVKNFVEGV